MTASIKFSSAIHSTAPAACIRISANFFWLSVVLVFAQRTLIPRPIAAGVFGMARTMDALVPNNASKNEIGVPAAMESVSAEVARPV